MEDRRFNFNISLDYRTFYPDGNIISLTNEQKKLHLSIFLEKSFIKLYFLHKREEKIEKSNSELKVGRWHQVEVLKHGKHIAVFIDKEKSIYFDLPKRLPFKSLSVGGIVSTPGSYSELQESFKGCMKNLYLNGKARKIPSESSCFKDVEFGAYFTGISHLTQVVGFHLGKEMDLSFQFKTLNYNGIIFSIISTTSGVQFELSLADKMVVASLLGEETLLTLDQKLKTDSSCDYKWHSIRMELKKNHFILQVDDLKSVERKIEKIPTNFGFADVYIGGKPDKYSTAEESANNFAGCVRSVTLNGDSLHIKNPSSDKDIVQYMCPQLGN